MQLFVDACDDAFFSFLFILVFSLVQICDSFLDEGEINIFCMYFSRHILCKNAVTVNLLLLRCSVKSFLCIGYAVGAISLLFADVIISLWPVTDVCFFQFVVVLSPSPLNVIMSGWGYVLL